MVAPESRQQTAAIEALHRSRATGLCLIMVTSRAYRAIIVGLGFGV